MGFNTPSNPNHDSLTAVGVFGKVPVGDQCVWSLRGDESQPLAALEKASPDLSFPKLGAVWSYSKLDHLRILL